MFITILPFWILLRVAIYFFEHYNTGAWPSIFIALIVTLIVLCIYGLIVFRIDFIGKDKQISLTNYIKVCFFIILAYIVHGIFFISSNNTKSSEVNKEINELHPILRLSLSTLIHLEGDLIVTDASRVPDDYGKMGLKVNTKSLHFKQNDGYVHACDLRTLSHSQLRNFLLKSYFDIVGFQTLRHTGTEDHLHVALPRKR